VLKNSFCQQWTTFLLQRRKLFHLHRTLQTQALAAHLRLFPFRRMWIGLRQVPPPGRSKELCRLLSDPAPNPATIFISVRSLLFQQPVSSKGKYKQKGNSCYAGSFFALSVYHGLAFTSWRFVPFSPPAFSCRSIFGLVTIAQMGTTIKESLRSEDVSGEKGAI
jgi:hypothetical protein